MQDAMVTMAVEWPTLPERPKTRPGYFPNHLYAGDRPMMKQLFALAALWLAVAARAAELPYNDAADAKAEVR